MILWNYWSHYNTPGRYPTGSSLGPILYSLYINDHPQPIFKSTIISQFADDIVHVTESNLKGKNRNRTALSRLKKELKQTLQWERNWKIKANPSKCKILVSGTKTSLIDKLGGVKINNVKIKTCKTTKILGFNLTSNKFSKCHVSTIIAGASNNLNKLQKSKSAPAKAKLHLYKSLIRHILEYLCYPLTLMSKTSQCKM